MKKTDKKKIREQQVDQEISEKELTQVTGGGQKPPPLLHRQH